ncbi:hypothetical protein MCNF_06580 [Mycolicibacterium confluentis]|uniref:GIY-YIG domain-containing protein n=1 Tax=Mycolicibacterium confluentis TaxID=28047 RepID=A0A7I7XSK7_9MYCO|nr:hypothetical protein MCNF_06580 [Mycolicibacterium confluentis]
MKGVYVIHDVETGNAYVGAAYGDTGIWARLRQYVDGLNGYNSQSKNWWAGRALTTPGRTSDWYSWSSGQCGTHGAAAHRAGRGEVAAPD